MLVGLVCFGGLLFVFSYVLVGFWWCVSLLRCCGFFWFCFVWLVGGRLLVLGFLGLCGCSVVVFFVIDGLFRGLDFCVFENGSCWLFFWVWCFVLYSFCWFVLGCGIDWFFLGVFVCWIVIIGCFGLMGCWWWKLLFWWFV